MCYSLLTLNSLANCLRFSLIATVRFRDACQKPRILLINREVLFQRRFLLIVKADVGGLLWVARYLDRLDLSGMKVYEGYFIYLIINCCISISFSCNRCLSDAEIWWSLQHTLSRIFVLGLASAQPMLN